jgi:hypothetical protein
VAAALEQQQQQQQQAAAQQAWPSLPQGPPATARPPAVKAGKKGAGAGATGGGGREDLYAASRGLAPTVSATDDDVISQTGDY